MPLKTGSTTFGKTTDGRAVMIILNEKEPFETDEEYATRIKQEGEYLELVSDGTVRTLKGD